MGWDIMHQLTCMYQARTMPKIFFLHPIIKRQFSYWYAGGVSIGELSFHDNVSSHPVCEDERYTTPQSGLVNTVDGLQINL